MSAEQATRTAWRLVGLGLVAVLVQVCAVSQITLFDATADLVPLAVGYVALLLGPSPGMLFGFSAGLFLDTCLLSTLGLSSLVLTAVGYAAGRLQEQQRDVNGPLVVLAVGLAISAVAAFGFALMQFLLGANAPVSFLLLRQLIATVAVSTLVALPVHALVRRLLADVLPEDARPHRRRRRVRRAASTRSVRGGLTPLQRP